MEDKLRTKFLELDRAISNVKGEIAKLNVSSKEVQKKVAQSLSHGGNQAQKNAVQLSQQMVDQFVKNEDYSVLKSMVHDL